MTRIIGGAAGGRRLRAPAGRATRPTSDRVREALFSSLEALTGGLAGCRFLDAYAGSGAVGLEALSRGAAAVTLVEQDRSAAATVRQNVRAVGLDGATVVEGRVERLAASLSRRTAEGAYDVVFLDPPYSVAADRVAALLTDLATANLLAAGAVVVVERARRDGGWTWPEGFQALRERTYGETMLWYGRHAPSQPSTPDTRRS